MKEGHIRINKVIGSYLKARRIEKGIEPEALARRIGRKAKYILDIEEGQRPIGFLEFLDALDEMRIDSASAMREIMATLNA